MKIEEFNKLDLKKTKFRIKDVEGYYFADKFFDTEIVLKTSDVSVNENNKGITYDIFAKIEDIEDYFTVKEKNNNVADLSLREVNNYHITTTIDNPNLSKFEAIFYNPHAQQTQTIYFLAEATEDEDGNYTEAQKIFFEYMKKNFSIELDEIDGISDVVRLYYEPKFLTRKELLK
ncbi:hypothetical protein EZS27_010888 [termite gut metagenome]|uniref:Uncharacterized protein n=1 Tax=termite gut metagenome TaxID=433724 RepID=A0A5J4S7M5_9ZZZZ